MKVSKEPKEPKVSKETVQESLRFAIAHNSVKSWEAYYILAVKYFDGKVTRKVIEAKILAKYHVGAISPVKG
jgi:hypothetical protein